MRFLYPPLYIFSDTMEDFERIERAALGIAAMLQCQIILVIPNA